jgi:hypothetical protein
MRSTGSSVRVSGNAQLTVHNCIRLCSKTTLSCPSNSPALSLESNENQGQANQFVYSENSSLFHSGPFNPSYRHSRTSASS